MKRYRVRVIPRSARNQVEETGPDHLKVKLTAPPVDGKANEALIQVLSDHFKIKKSAVTILSGETSRHKWVQVEEPK